MISAADSLHSPPMQTKHKLIVEPIGLDIEKLPRPLNWNELFGNDNPVEIEIGIGKGTFITEQAKARPDTNFLGIEWARWFWRYASDRLRRNQCLNARTVRAEASFFLTEFVPDASISVLHIYFPDPWPKKRHHKRRLIQPPFVQLLASRIAPGGYLHCATDWQPYAEQMLEVLGGEPQLANTCQGYAERPAWRPQTKFETRGLRLGHGVWDLIFARVPAEGSPAAGA